MDVWVDPLSCGSVTVVLVLPPPRICPLARPHRHMDVWVQFPSPVR